MRRALLICLAALAFVPAAQAWHHHQNLQHWPTSTVATHGGFVNGSGHVMYGCGPTGCTSPIDEAYPNGPGRPCAPECRLIKVRDRLGLGLDWHLNVLVPNLKMISEASRNRIVFTTHIGTTLTYDTTGKPASYPFDLAKAHGPGTITLMRAGPGQATAATSLHCFYYDDATNGPTLDARFSVWEPGDPTAAAYCQGNENHQVTGGIMFTASYLPGGSLASRMRYALGHELGHAALNLRDTYLEPNCGIALGGDVSIMCANPHINYFFSVHDRQAIELLYDHTP
jgi:hypothetical protein